MNMKFTISYSLSALYSLILDDQLSKMWHISFPISFIICFTLWQSAIHAINVTYFKCFKFGKCLSIHINSKNIDSTREHERPFSFRLSTVKMWKNIVFALYKHISYVHHQPARITCLCSTDPEKRWLTVPDVSSFPEPIPTSDNDRSQVNSMMVSRSIYVTWVRERWSFHRPGGKISWFVSSKDGIENCTWEQIWDHKTRREDKTKRKIDKKKDVKSQLFASQ